MGAAQLLRNLLGATFGIQGPIWKHGANTFGPKGTIWEHLTTALGSLVDQLGTIKVWTLDHHLSEHTFVLQTAFFSSRTNPLITNWQIYLLPYDRTFEFPWERLLLGRQVESYF